MVVGCTQKLAYRKKYRSGVPESFYNQLTELSGASESMLTEKSIGQVFPKASITS
jgi:hypothetical protein